MVKLGIMEWICEQLLAGKGATAASEYSIQYGSALLMNLALRSVGRRRSETFAILPILSRMLEFPNEQVCFSYPRVSKYRRLFASRMLPRIL